MPFLEKNIVFKQSRRDEWQLNGTKVNRISYLVHIWRTYGQQRNKQLFGVLTVSREKNKQLFQGIKLKENKVSFSKFQYCLIHYSNVF